MIIEVRSEGGVICEIDGFPVEFRPLSNYGKGQYVFRIGETVLSVFRPHREMLTIDYLRRYAKEQGWEFEFVEKERVIR